MTTSAPLLNPVSEPETWYSTFEFGGDDREIHPQLYLENQQIRCQVIKALGGEKVVEAIPTLRYPIHHKDSNGQSLLTGYMNELQELRLPDGLNIAQTEDFMGRRAVMLRTIDKTTGSEAFAIVFQRRRETCCTTICRGQDGSGWLAPKIAEGVNGITDTTETIETLIKLIMGKHSKLTTPFKGTVDTIWKHPNS